MTKAQLSRLIVLESLPDLNGTQIRELLGLQADFENWEPAPALPRCPNGASLSWTCRRCGYVEIVSE